MRPLIGNHASALLLVIFLTPLGVIAALWRLFETGLQELWAHPDGWRQRVLRAAFRAKDSATLPTHVAVFRRPIRA